MVNARRARTTKGREVGRFSTIARRGHVDTDASQILEAVSSTAGFTSINPHRTADPKLVITPSGPPTGVGSGFAFRGKDGKGTQTVAEVNDSHVIHDIDMGSFGRSRQRISATPSPAGGCDVEWSVTLDAGHNPLLRIFGLMADKVLGPSLETGISNLASATWR